MTLLPGTIKDRMDEGIVESGFNRVTGTATVHFQCSCRADSLM